MLVNPHALHHHRDGIEPVIPDDDWPSLKGQVLCPECLLPVYIAPHTNEWACIDPECMFA